jgi:hypothetical protein
MVATGLGRPAERAFSDALPRRHLGARSEREQMSAQEPATLPMLASELYAALRRLGRTEEQAEALIFDWASWRGLEATGVFYRVHRGDGANQSSVTAKGERAPIPKRFWTFLARADRSEMTRAAAQWAMNSFSFTVTIATGHRLPAGDYQDTWDAVLFDRGFAETLLLEQGRPGGPPVTSHGSRQRRGPKKGTGRYPGDAELVQRGKELMAIGYTARGAASELAPLAKGPSFEAKVDRLRKAIGRN